MDNDEKRSHHDLGGVSKFMCEAVDVEPHALTAFDREVDALRGVLGAKAFMTVDELRRDIEAIPEAGYHRLTYYRRWIRSITDNLLRKGIITEAELAERMEATDQATPGQGAKMVARAWTDPGYRALMLEDSTKAAEAMNIPMRGMPPLSELENTDAVHNLIVCTLCGYYPRAVLGYPPFWYKSAAYRARAVREPRGLLAEFRTTLPEDVKIHVVDSTADYRWMVLPKRPAGTDGWSAEQLAAIVREGDMVGVTVPSAWVRG